MNGKLQRLAFAGSLALNVALAAWWLRPATPSGAAAPPAHTAFALSANSSAGSGATDTDRPATPAPSPATPPFRWSEIESEDYRQYIANLRAVGCPESVIRDLIAADVSQLFAGRLDAIRSSTRRAYWQKYDQTRPDPEQQRKLEELSREHTALLRELLGAAASADEFAYLIHAHPQPGERPLLFLPEDRREAALKALSEAGIDAKLDALYSRGRWSPAEEQKLRDEKDRLLRDVLSPAEFAEYRLRHSPEAQSLRVELEYFDLTPAEFKQLLDAREQSRGKIANGDLVNRGPAVEQVRELFGEERAKEFEKVSNFYYQNARRALEALDLPVEPAEDAWRIARQAQAAAERVAKDTTLPVEERQRQVRALQSEADRRLNETLGEKAARPVRRDLGVLFTVTSGNIKP